MLQSLQALFSRELTRVYKHILHIMPNMKSLYYRYYSGIECIDAPQINAPLKDASTT